MRNYLSCDSQKINAINEVSDISMLFFKNLVPRYVSLPIVGVMIHFLGMLEINEGTGLKVIRRDA